MNTRFLHRRQFIQSAVSGSLLFPSIVQQLMAEEADPLAPRAPHFPAKAKLVIFLLMTGGVSLVDTFDRRQESDATLASYGLQRGATTGVGWQCLAARRLVERGVRFVELIDTGSSGNWDAHGDVMDHVPLAKNVDEPIAALLKDLKQRGMLDDTLVVWTTEFGRTPFINTADAKGREHHPWAFSSRLAGGGVKPGIVHGATDEIGLKVVAKPVHVHDVNATILHLMGFDHERLTYRHAGRDYRLTDGEGHVVKEVIA